MSEWNQDRQAPVHHYEIVSLIAKHVEIIYYVFSPCFWGTSFPIQLWLHRFLVDTNLTFIHCKILKKRTACRPTSEKSSSIVQSTTNTNFLSQRLFQFFQSLSIEHSGWSASLIMSSFSSFVIATAPAKAFWVSQNKDSGYVLKNEPQPIRQALNLGDVIPVHYSAIGGWISREKQFFQLRWNLFVWRWFFQSCLQYKNACAIFSFSSMFYFTICVMKNEKQVCQFFNVLCINMNVRKRSGAEQ